MTECVDLTFVVQPWMIWTVVVLMLVSAVVSTISSYYAIKIRQLQADRVAGPDK